MFTFVRKIEEFQKTVEECRQIFVVKGAEYAGIKGDALSNFREVAAKLQLPMTTVWAVFASKHWEVILQHANDEQHGRNRERAEPIEGRIHDMINYLILLKCILADEVIDLDKALGTGDKNERGATRADADAGRVSRENKNTNFPEVGAASFEREKQTSSSGPSSSGVTQSGGSSNEQSDKSERGTSSTAERSDKIERDTERKPEPREQIGTTDKYGTAIKPFIPEFPQSAGRAYYTTIDTACICGQSPKGACDGAGKSGTGAECTRNTSRLNTDGSRTPNNYRHLN